MRGLVTALGLLTVLPVPPVADIDRRLAGRAMAAFPWVGLLVGSLAGAVLWGVAALGGGGLLGAALALAVVALLTGALHLDGLADTADGLASSWEVARALAVMRTGDLGPAGAVTLIVVLGLQAVVAGELLTRPLGWLIVSLAFAAGRAALALGTLRGVPAARTDGLGAAVAGSVSPAVAGASWLLVVGALTGAALVAQLPWWGGGVALAAGLAAYGAVIAWVGARVKRPLVAGLVFVLGWEPAVLLFPGYLKHATVAYYLQALVPHAMPQDSTINILLQAFADLPGIVPSLIARFLAGARGLAVLLAARFMVAQVWQSHPPMPAG